MRLWHYKLLPYLPDAQFRGQLRELIAIMRDWRDTGKTNHLLINRVVEYPKAELYTYFLLYSDFYYDRYCKVLTKYKLEFADFANYTSNGTDIVYMDWHNKEYLRICMANLYEKYKFGIGKSRISDEEWAELLRGYEKMTSEIYTI